MSVSQRSKRLKRSETRAIKAQGLKGLIRYGDRETVETAAGSVDTASWCVSVAGIIPVGSVAASRWWAVADGHGGLAMRGAFPTRTLKKSPKSRVQRWLLATLAQVLTPKNTVCLCAYLSSPLAPLFSQPFAGGVVAMVTVDGSHCDAASSWLVTRTMSRNHARHAEFFGLQKAVTAHCEPPPEFPDSNTAHVTRRRNGGERRRFVASDVSPDRPSRVPQSPRGGRTGE